DKILAQIAAELRSQYTLAYYPAIPMMGVITIFESRPDMGTTFAPEGVTSAGSHKSCQRHPVRSIVDGTKGASVMQHRPRRIISCVLLLGLSIVVLAQVMRAKDEKLKPEQVIAKHLESIGTAEKL